MALLSPQNVTTAGKKPTLAAATAGGDTFRTTGRELFAVKNAGTGSVTLTFDVKRTFRGQDYNETAVIPDDTDVYLCGPFPADVFGDEDGIVSVSYSGVTSVTVGVLHPKEAGF